MSAWGHCCWMKDLTFRWLAKLKKMGDNENTFRLCCKKLKLPGVHMCMLSHNKTEYGSSGIKVLMHHQLQNKHKAAICSLQHTSSLSDATTTTNKTRISGQPCVRPKSVYMCVESRAWTVTHYTAINWANQCGCWRSDFPDCQYLMHKPVQIEMELSVKLQTRCSF